MYICTVVKLFPCKSSTFRVIFKEASGRNIVCELPKCCSGHVGKLIQLGGPFSVLSGWRQ